MLVPPERLRLAPSFPPLNFLQAASLGCEVHARACAQAVQVQRPEGPDTEHLARLCHEIPHQRGHVEQLPRLVPLAR